MKTLPSPLSPQQKLIDNEYDQVWLYNAFFMIYCLGKGDLRENLTNQSTNPRGIGKFARYMRNYLGT